MHRWKPRPRCRNAWPAGCRTVSEWMRQGTPPLPSDHPWQTHSLRPAFHGGPLSSHSLRNLVSHSKFYAVSSRPCAGLCSSGTHIISALYWVTPILSLAAAMSMHYFTCNSDTLGSDWDRWLLSTCGCSAY